VLRAPTATSQFGTVTNLNATAAAGAVFTASVQIYDAIGASHVATITYTNTASGAWDYSITLPGDEIAGGTAGTPEVIANGNLSFGPTGQLDLVDGVAADDITVPGPAWANGAEPSDFVWNLVDANGVASLTGFAGPSATSSVTQNGAAAGTINSISINSAGDILATFGTGSSVSVGQLAMANFNNPQGLVKLGSNRFGESASAGIPNVGAAGTGGRGSLIGSSLEQSNVDIAQEFTQMILAQRGYQANSKSITVADELLVETLNLKR
jgi:flagellar hook protein FlgE